MPFFTVAQAPSLISGWVMAAVLMFRSSRSLAMRASLADHMAEPALMMVHTRIKAMFNDVNLPVA
ncbi:hypothetical protein GCM10010176_093470 [Nonomuraea spiralis]|nr:hypothetical protein GCM10010176_093470 [Nonomuraea spiralis]